MSGASATMVGLTVAVAALLYALLGIPLLKFLHEKGALNRLLFDLICNAATWILALALSLLSAMPEQALATNFMRVSTAAALAGLLGFIPIGSTFWMLLRHSGVEPFESSQHDFDEPTNPF